jgi:hypothetical protein
MDVAGEPADRTFGAGVASGLVCVKGVGIAPARPLPVGALLILVGGGLVVSRVGFITLRRGLITLRRGLISVRQGLIEVGSRSVGLTVRYARPTEVADAGLV